MTGPNASGRVDSAHGLGALESALCAREIPALNGLRALAVGAVMIYHAGYTWFPGGQGVTLFFVLSGFLITHLLIKEARSSGTVSLRGFYARRSLRIFPAFYLYWLVIVTLLLVTGREIEWGHVWTTFFYVGNYWIAMGLPENNSLSHAWSLAIEEQFYLLLPGLFVLLRARLWLFGRVLVGLILLVWLNRVLRVLLGSTETYLYHATDTRIDHLLIGCLLAVMVARGLPSWFGRLLKPWAYAATIAMLLVSISASYLSPVHYRMTVGYAVEPVLLAVVIMQSVALRPWVMALAPIEYVGRISYGCYLYQQVLVPAGQGLIPDGWGGLPGMLAGMSLTILAAHLSYRFYESKFLLLKRRWTSGLN